jgi:signal transduction histidine kinase
MDSLAAPLLAIEINRASLSASFADAPVLAPRLIKGYVLREASGRWMIRRYGQPTAWEPLSSDSPFSNVDWERRLGTVDHPNGMSAEIASADSLLAIPADDLILWPDPSPLGQTGKIGQGGQMAHNNSGSQEIQNRNQLVQQFQQIAANAQQSVAGNLRTSPSFRPLQPVWVNGELVLARQAPVANQSATAVIEVCWLNWQEWKGLLSSQLEGSSIPLRLQACDVEPVGASATPFEGWRMVSLPIRLGPKSNSLPAPWPVSLIVVWSLLSIVAIALGWLMRQTLALSERRAAFVSAVTHELRTPLTTFRLYTEMLSEGVATDPQQQQTYFQILNREANRLTHLVENVLSYARLEHGRPTARNETLTASNLVNRCRPRLEQRIAETPLSLSFQASAATQDATLTTNPMAVEQILFNLIDNSCKYARDAADPRILCDLQVDPGRAYIRVSDFGPGLSAAARKTLFQAFQKSSTRAAESAPGVGLGLALSQRIAHELGGSIHCFPNKPTGLCFELHLPLDVHCTA